MFSYAMLRIAASLADAGRLAEWRDNANGQAIIIGDRNISASAADSAVRGLLTTRAGEWKGDVVWGDNHAERSQTHIMPETRYGGLAATNDSLFVDGSALGTVEKGVRGYNAMMVWD